MTDDQQLDGFFDAITGAAQKYAPFIQEQATKFGIATPIDKKITMLRTGRDTVKKNRYRVESDLRQFARTALANNSQAAMRARASLNQEGSKAVSKASVVVQYYARAIMKAQEIQSAIANRRATTTLFAEYAIMEKLAVDESSHLNQMFQNFFANLQAGKLILNEQTGSERWGEVGTAFGDIGGELKQATIRAGELTKGIAPYLPYIAAGVGLMYAAPFLRALAPRRAR